VARLALEDPSWAEPRTEARVFGVIRVLRLFLRIEVVEISEKLVEPMHGRQELVAIAEMVLAELSAGVTERLAQFSYGRVFEAQGRVGAGQPKFRQAGADRRLPGDESGASSGAALLAVQGAFLSDAVDVRSPVAHDAVVVGTDVEPADIVGHDHQDVR